MALGDQAGVEAVKRLEIDVPIWLALLNKILKSKKIIITIEDKDATTD